MTESNDNFLYICQNCTVITWEPVNYCPVCGCDDAPLSLGFELRDVEVEYA